MKQEVLELILNRPNVRTVEIADKLDMEPEQVRPLIADEIRKGIIVEEPITAPNGRTVLSFRYTSAAPAAPVVTEHVPNPFPARVLRALPPTERPAMPRAPALGKPAPAAPPMPAADPLSLALAPAPAHVAAPLVGTAVVSLAGLAGHEAVAASGPLDIDVPVTRKLDVPLIGSIDVHKSEAKSAAKVEFSRVELALACLRAANGPVSTHDLLRAMMLPPGQSPSGYLKYAIKDGRVARQGKDWIIGAAAVEPSVPVVTPRAQVPDLAPAAPVVQAAAQVEPVAELPAAKVPELAPAPQAQAAQVAEPYEVPKFIGGSPNYPIPPVTEGAPEIDRPGRYENGEFRATPEEIMGHTAASLSESQQSDTWETSKLWMANTATLTAANMTALKLPLAAPANDPVATKFRAGVMSDGTLHLSVPGVVPFDLAPEHARELYLFLRNLGYAAWPTAA